MEILLHAAVTNALWATLLALGAAAARRVFPRRPALIHGLWLLVLLKLVTPSLVPLPRALISSLEPPNVEPPVATRSVEVPKVAEVIQPAETPAPVIDAMPASVAPIPINDGDHVSPRHWGTVLSMLWVVGAASWWVIVVAQVVRFRRLLQSAQPVPEALRVRVDQLAAHLGLRAPTVWLVPAPIPPMVWAPVGPPRLILPENLWSHLDQERQDTVLMHELAHLKRRDHWVRRFEVVILGLYWWNPVAWWARRRLEEAEEQCCDAWVAWALPKSVDAYAEALVATAVFLSGSRILRPVGATGVGRVPSLKRRLSMIPRDSASVPSVRPVQRRALIVGSLCLLLLPGWALSQSTEAARSGTAETPAGSDAVDAKPAEKPGEKRDSTPAEQPAEEPGVEKDELAASQPLVREVSDYQEYRGYIEATQSIEIRSSIGGILTEVNIQAGQAVKKGDLLFKIDDRSYRARLDKADAEVARAAAQLKNRELALKGVKDLNARAVVSDGEVTRIEGDRDEAMSSLRAAKALRDLAQLELDSSRISAPITGRISRPQLSVGSQVVAGDTVLATLASTDPMGVAFHVDENTVLKLGREKVGAGLKVGLGPGIPVQIGLVDEDNLPRHGRIESVDSRVDPRSGSLRCLATVPDPEGILIPGLSARVRMMIGKPKKTLLVAPRAVFGSDPQQFVLVVNDQGVVTRRSVRLGKQYDDLRAVDQGLTEGEWIIVNGFDKATLGKNLKPKKAPMPTAAPATR